MARTFRTVQLFRLQWLRFEGHIGLMSTRVCQSDVEIETGQTDNEEQQQQ